MERGTSDLHKEPTNMHVKGDGEAELEKKQCKNNAPEKGNPGSYFACGYIVIQRLLLFANGIIFLVAAGLIFHHSFLAQTIAVPYHQENEKSLTRAQNDKIQTVGINGGEIQLQGCKVSFPNDALDEETDFVLTVKADEESYPKNYIPISPILEITTPKPILKKDVTIELESWVKARANLWILILQKHHGEKWTVAQQLSMKVNNKISFRTSHFTSFTAVTSFFGFLPRMLEWYDRLKPIVQVYGLVNYDVINYLHYNEHGVLWNTFVVDSEARQHTIEGLESLSSFRRAFELPIMISVNANDKIAFRLECKNPATFAFEAEEESRRSVEKSIDVSEIGKRLRISLNFQMAVADETFSGKVVFHYEIHPHGNRIVHVPWPIKSG